MRMLDHALAYARLGWPIFPVTGKRPLPGTRGFKDATTSEARVRAWWSENPEAGIALATGRMSGVWVVDLDGEAGEIAIEDWIRLNGQLPDTRESRTGGGGRHLFFRMPAAGEVPCRTKVLPGVDVRGDGGYVVLPPSFHESGRTYQWKIEDTEAEPPPYLLEAVLGRPARPPSNGAAQVRTPSAYAAAGIARECAAVASAPEGTRNDRLNVAAHALGRFVGDGSVAREAIEGALLEAATTAGLPEREALKTIASGLGARIAEGRVNGHDTNGHANGHELLGVDVVRAARAARLDPVDSTESSPPSSPSPPPAQPKPNLRELLAYKERADGTRQIISSPGNVSTILRHDARWQDVIAWDVFGQRMVTLRQPPWHDNERPSEPWAAGKPWTDADDTRLAIWLERTWGLTIPFDKAARIADSVARAQSYHPVRAYLGALQWDGHPRLDGWLSTYLGVEYTDYTACVGAWWLISAVARIYNPGCQADYVLILEGPQGLGKSTSIELLFGREWFADNLPELGTPDSYGALAGKWAVEIAELDALGRAQSATAKRFFSARIDHYRAPYDRRAQDWPRQCVFFGTTNTDAYLKDETGNRRYWPALCRHIDRAALARDRDQIWAEAAHRFEQGARWHPDTPEEIAACAEEQEERFEVDEWEGTIADYLGKRFKREPVTSEEIATVALDLRRGQVDRRVQTRIASCLRRLGHERAVRRIEGVSRKCFVPIHQKMPEVSNAY